MPASSSCVSPLIVKAAKADLAERRAGAHTDGSRRDTPLGAVTDQPAHLIDIMATLIDFSGAEYPKRVGERKIDPLQGRRPRAHDEQRAVIAGVKLQPRYVS